MFPMMIYLSMHLTIKNKDIPKATKQLKECLLYIQIIFIRYTPQEAPLSSH